MEEEIREKNESEGVVGSLMTNGGGTAEGFKDEDYVDVRAMELVDRMPGHKHLGCP